jgi:hypothetical protein
MIRALQYWAISTPKNEHLQTYLGERPGGLLLKEGKWEEWIESTIVVYTSEGGFPRGGAMEGGEV